MKNKSTRHKELNTFKFQPFSERISNIDVDIFHKVGHENEADSENTECYFHQAIEKWSTLNITESYAQFTKEIKTYTLVTLPQLLLEKEHVVEVLIKHLKLKNSLSLQPLLDIVVALAKDLRRDFYQFFKPFFDVLLELLNSRDPDQLEWTFTCLAYLFKFLWRFFVKDITTVFNALLPLLSNSKPDYIHNFAASSFAFVARKVKDWPSFLLHILKTVKSQKDGVLGCGKLLFEAICGVNGQFHSCAQSLLPFLLQSLGNSKFSQSTLFEILEVVVENIASNIHFTKCSLLWDSLIDNLKTLLKNWENSKNDKVAKEIELVLKLLGQGVEYKNGKILQDYAPVVATVRTILNMELPDSILETTVKIAVLLLICKNLKMTQEQVSILINNVLKLPQESLLLYFVEKTAKLTLFEVSILPHFLKHCCKVKLNMDTFKVLKNLILIKSPLCSNSINLPNWAKYPINFGSENQNLAIEDVIFDHLNGSDPECYTSALIVLPHLNLTQNERTITVLSNKMSEFLLKLETEKEVKQKLQMDKVLLLLNNTVECFILLNEFDYLSDNFDTLVHSLAPVINIYALNILDLLLFVMRDRSHVMNSTTLRTLNQNLAFGFSSPFHEIRLVTAHIYSLFEDLPEFNLTHSSDPDVPKEKFQVFSLCYKVESIEPHVHTYRDQLQCLEKLNFDKPQMIMCKQTEFKTIPLRYLCGSLYINFKLLWDPVIKIIETHAHGLKVGEFWEIFGESLKEVVANVRLENGVEKEVYVAKQSSPDFVNYRLLLWKALDSFADIAEIKTRDVASLFLDFIENEYSKHNSLNASKCNIKQISSDTAEVVDEVAKVTTKPHGRNYSLRLLLHSLSIFSKVKSPKSMYREPELYKLYVDFLQHKNSEIQKAALDCLFNYKHKFLMPYKEHLYNLIDDKNFKNELTSFKIDKESDVIQPDHRPDLIPLILKIVFSKMNTKIGLRTGGKSSGQMRRNLVFRFIAGCQQDEMLSFVKLALQHYSKFLKENPEDIIKHIQNEITLENFISPKRLQSSINLINVILDQFGGLMSNELLTFILHVTVLIGAIVKVAFDHWDKVHKGYWPILKNLRTTLIKVIERFFAQFDRYPWTREQLNVTFDIFIWPHLTKFSSEGIHSPTPLLKLFHQWGLNPRYFALFVKHEDKNQSQYVLPHIIQLLLNEKSAFGVVEMIEEIIEKLVTLQSDDELKISTDNILPIPDNILNRLKIDQLNYGTCILLPFVPSVLLKFKRRLEQKKTLNQRELSILSRISEFVWESDTSESTLKLLLPQVLKHCTLKIDQEVETKLLTIIYNLLTNVQKPREHLKEITPLFGEVKSASGRKLLLSILQLFGSSAELSIIKGLNAFDAKWIDQPDFQVRHDTFKEVQTFLEKEEISLDLGILVIYNCYYMLKNLQELSVKENSGHCLKSLSVYLVNHYPKQVDYILNETMFPLIRRGMKSRNNDFRNDCILILGVLARTCPNSHLVLRDLNKYTNINDSEVDFFENITHLQLHRHARALLKFCAVSRDLTSYPNVRTLTQFVLPLASFYLCNEKYIGKNSVIDAAIECIGMVCRILPWHQYESLLKFYLNKLQKSVDYQKQLVRVTVAILDAFHYDLSKAEVVGISEQSGEREDKDANSQKISLESHQESLPNELAEENLEEVESEEQIEEEYEVEESMTVVKISEKNPILCKSTATRVTKSIQVVLLPQLHRALAELTQHDVSHKINRKLLRFQREEEDLLRVPISLALVKLLQKLPKDILEANLPGIFMKLCSFLKSHLESVRRAARETLQQIMKTLGPNYLNLLLGEMTPLLNRGFQVHVLVFTTHAVLSCLKPSYQPTDIDKVLITVLKLCQADLFGSLCEEKEVEKIAVKTSEARSTKSFDLLQILAQFVTDKCLIDLILPIKNVLQTSHSYKTVQKAEECLRHIALGLADNEFVPTQSLLIFAYGASSESVPELLPQEKPTLTEKEKIRLQRERSDCFIIPKGPVGRSGRISNAKTSLKTNAHLLVEFGLRLCHVMLKRQKLKDEEFKPYLDPFVGVFLKCLTSKHIKLSSLTLQCLTWVLKYELPSIKENIQLISENLFTILHKYASAGLSKGDNFDLVQAAFKAMSVLLRDVKYHTIDTEQLKILLLYAEQDMHDHDRQATAFNLLKAIIARKLVVPEIHAVMKKVAELSITSELTHVRAQARAVFHQYLMDYPLGDKLEKYLSFYLSQLSYEMQFGRESAIEMVGNLINNLPMKILINQCGSFFITLSARLVNDEVPECRKQISDCISSLLTKLERKHVDPLFDIVLLWFKDNKLAHRRLAAQLCGIFVTVEKSSFAKRLSKLFPVMFKQFSLKEEENDEKERLKDHLLFQMLQMLLKVCTYCASFFKMPQVDELNRNIQKLLAYPHDWVRLAAAQYIGFLLAATDIETLSSSIVANKSESGYLREKPMEEVKSLVLDLCDQLQPGIKSDLAEQTIKNLVFLARVIEKLPQEAKISLFWLTKRMRKIVNSEIVESSGTALRTEVFKWIAALTTVLDVDKIVLVLNHLLAPLVREMITVEESNAPLRQLSKEVAGLLKKKVGLEVYTKTLSSLQQNLAVKRAERKRTRVQAAVTNPELFAKKKLKRHEKKREAKKRKIESMKGKKSFKKRKIVDLDPESEVM